MTVAIRQESRKGITMTVPGNRLVYELYDLTEEEIRIVEGEVK